MYRFPTGATRGGIRIGAGAGAGALPVRSIGALPPDGVCTVGTPLYGSDEGFVLFCITAFVPPAATAPAAGFEVYAVTPAPTTVGRRDSIVPGLAGVPGWEFARIISEPS